MVVRIVKIRIETKTKNAPFDKDSYSSETTDNHVICKSNNDDGNVIDSGTYPLRSNLVARSSWLIRLSDLSPQLLESFHRLLERSTFWGES